MKRFPYLGPLLILLAGVLVLGARYLSYQNRPRAFQNLEEGMALNSVVFQNRVIDQYPRVSASRLHLVVFLDPVKDCPTCIAEYTEWVAPLAETDRGLYDLTLFIQDGLSEPELDEFLALMGLTRDQAVVFGPGDPLAEFHHLGVFKVVVSQVRGIEWYEAGSRDLEAYREFGHRLRSTLREVQNSGPIPQKT